ncbi:putative zinc finger motif, C2HC5-type-domain-containing protein, partial [Syncephalis pseudoplumigaleata]
MGISRDDLQDMIPYVLSLSSEKETRDYLAGLLGDSAEATSLIDELLRRKRDSGKDKAAREQQQTSQKKAKDKQASGIQLAQAFGGGGSVYRKSDKDDVYVVGGAAQREQTSGGPKSKGKGRKERAGKVAANRPACYCMAKVHKLLTNCLKCGKIICASEGPGPCTFCGNLVESSQQQLEVLAREQRKRKQAQTNRKAPTGPIKPDHTRSYKAKVVGGFAEGWDDASESLEEAEDAEQIIAAEDADARNARLLAEARKERLLEYDRTSARRTHVIASDFALPNDVDDRWLDPEERAQQARLRQERLDALKEQERRSGKARVITIDLAGRCVVEERRQDKKALPSSLSAASPQRVPSPANVMAKAIEASSAGTSSQSLKNTLKNPLLTKKMRPVYVAEKKPTPETTKAASKSKASQAASNKA